MGFQQGLSGLNASSKNLDVIGNNIANANTVGFKSSRAEFADLYAASFASSGTLSGLGVKTGGIAQQFDQGSISSTNNSLDVAITGNGFFRMVDGAGSISYTRNGQFQLDSNGYLVNNGDMLTGWTANATTGVLVAGGTPAALQLTVGNVGAQATTTASLGVNLNASSATISRAAAPTGVGSLSISDPSTYTSSTSATVYDSLGVAHTQTFYFSKVADNQWEVQTAFDGGGLTKQGYLLFTSNGQLDTTSTPTDPLTTLSGTNVGSFTFSSPSGYVGGATDPLSYTVNFAGTSQYGSAFGVNSISQDGYADGVLTGVSIGDDGVILGTYSNGQNKSVGQIVLANFANSQGLTPTGNNRWAESYSSGQPRIGEPLSSDFGSLQSAALEDANVDLTAELINLITAQRNYQANAQTIKAQDTILQTLVNLR